MTTDEADAVGRSGTAAGALAMLAEVIGDVPEPTGGRVRAALDPRSPHEGLALLDAYVKIEDRRLRQALLDLVTAVSGATLR